jgi:hypothetical protein
MTSSTPATAAKIDDVFGSALAAATAIHMVWPNRVHCRKYASDLSPWGSSNRDGGAQASVNVGASAIGHWQWTAIFRATWLLRTKSSTPSPGFSARPWIGFLLATDELDSTISITG